MEVIGLCLNFLGSLFLVCANPKLDYDKKLKAVIIVTKRKMLLPYGLWFLVFGFLFQLIEKIP